MKLAFAAACLVASLSFAGSAFADGRAVATLQQPITGKKEIVAAHSVWECEQTTCVAGATPENPLGPSDCHELARHVGPFADFKDEHHTLTPAELDRCDAGTLPASVTASL
jgi:hypothetical protein